MCKILQTPGEKRTGLIDLALAVRKYVKPAFGTDSSQNNSISGLEFTRPR